MKTAPLLAAAVMMLVASAASAGTGGSLRPIQLTPLTLRGSGFAGDEHVRLTVFGTRVVKARARARPDGRLTVRVPLATTYCTVWLARAIGVATGPAVYRSGAERCPAGGVLVGTGIAGLVRRGPISPVCVAGRPCDAPASGVPLAVWQGRALVVRTTSRADGRFAVALAPGRYVVAVSGRAPAQAVTVAATRIAHLDFLLDTGIR